VGEVRAPVNSKNLKNLPVMSIEGGEKLGTVSRAYVDAKQKRIHGFAYDAGGGFMKTESEPKVDAEEVHTLGPDALMLDHKGGETGASVSQRYSELLILDEIAGLPVLAENGTSAGQMASVEFDQHSYQLTGIDISHGRFKGHQRASIDQIVTIGRDYVIVQNAILEPGEPASTPVELPPLKPPASEDEAPA
jgi:uncharacterized protein YrrD